MSGGEDSAAAPPLPPGPKVDPETLAIRSRPPRAIRFRRGLIVGLAGLSSVSLVAITWVALKPRIVAQIATDESLSQPGVKPQSDALSGLPENYGAVPKLGPPLPGDLGRPILNHQRAMANETGSIDPASGAATAAAQAEAVERERQLTELRSARQSGLLVARAGQGNAGTIGAPVQPAVAAAADDGGKAGANVGVKLDPDGDPNAQARKAAFSAALDGGGDVNPHGLARPVSPYTLSAGSVIAASLITGLRSDLPGLVTAQVTERVFDSATGRHLLIPQGARLIGAYDSVVAFGQKRALIVWQRILLPDGSSLRIDNVPATDASGYAGLEDKLNLHSWQLLKGVVLSTLLGVGSELALSGDSDLVQAVRQSTQQSAGRAGDQLVARNLNVQPTITIRPGASVRLVVHKDLVMQPWEHR